jgi:hypothetical protein
VKDRIHSVASKRGKMVVKTRSSSKGSHLERPRLTTPSRLLTDQEHDLMTAI